MHRIARFHWTLAGAVAALVCACGDSARAPSRAPDTFGPDAVLVWQGVVACADCAGIDTRLSLQQGSDASARYQLVEAFLDEGGAEYFREEGRWERRGTLLTLHARSGGVRRYHIADDGELVAADLGGDEAGQGHSLAPAAGVMPGM